MFYVFVRLLMWALEFEEAARTLPKKVADAVVRKAVSDATPVVGAVAGGVAALAVVVIVAAVITVVLVAGVGVVLERRRKHTPG